MADEPGGGADKRAQTICAHERAISREAATRRSPAGARRDQINQVRSRLTRRPRAWPIRRAGSLAARSPLVAGRRSPVATSSPGASWLYEVARATATAAAATSISA
jgi:hypothetical protein